jgi:ferredoxin--NADP+ reductase
MAKSIQANATASSIELLTDHLMILRVKTDEPFRTFEPGQYATLGLPATHPRAAQCLAEAQAQPEGSWIRRAYSIASPPSQDELEFYLALVPDGALTSRLFALSPGDRLYISPKAVGRFTLQDIPTDRHLLLMSTGTGLAPYISMLKHDTFDGFSSRHVIVAHGVRHASDLGYRRYLEDLDQTHPNFHYVPVLSRDDPTWQGQKGYIQHILFEGSLEKQWGIEFLPDNTDVFLCGNPAMIDQALMHLQTQKFVVQKGRQPGNIHTEEYW